jgi:cytoskeletal protein CcmA (bactofilin family)
MFNAKKPDGTIDASSSSNSTPYAAHATASEANCSIINEWLVMRGDLESEGDILVKGKVHGNISCKLLIIDVGAIIEGSISAEEVVVRGSTRGIIKALRVRLEKTAQVDSEIYQDKFSAEEGARIKGSLNGYNEQPTSRIAAEAPAVIEKQIGASLYHLLDQARSAHHSHLTVAQ